jgi:hypothetical protein
LVSVSVRFSVVDDTYFSPTTDPRSLPRRRGFLFDEPFWRRPGRLLGLDIALRNWTVHQRTWISKLEPIDHRAAGRRLAFSAGFLRAPVSRGANGAGAFLTARLVFAVSETNCLRRIAIVRSEIISSPALFAHSGWRSGEFAAARVPRINRGHWLTYLVLRESRAVLKDSYALTLSRDTCWPQRPRCGRSHVPD